MAIPILFISIAFQVGRAKNSLRKRMKNGAVWSSLRCVICVKFRMGVRDDL